MGSRSIRDQSLPGRRRRERRGGAEIVGAACAVCAGRRVTVTGPGGESWMGYLISQAPNGAAMELEAENSPIGVSSITANMEARNQNGPLTLRYVDGQVRADVQNGSITISGNRG